MLSFYCQLGLPQPSLRSLIVPRLNNKVNSKQRLVKMVKENVRHPTNASQEHVVCENSENNKHMIHGDVVPATNRQNTFSGCFSSKQD